MVAYTLRLVRMTSLVTASLTSPYTLHTLSLFLPSLLSTSCVPRVVYRAKQNPLRRGLGGDAHCSRTPTAQLCSPVSLEPGTVAVAFLKEKGSFSGWAHTPSAHCLPPVLCSPTYSPDWQIMRPLLVEQYSEIHNGRLLPCCCKSLPRAGVCGSGPSI